MLPTPRARETERRERQRERRRSGNAPSLEPLGRLHVHALPGVSEALCDAALAEALVGPPGGVADPFWLGQVHRGELLLELGLLVLVLGVVVERDFGRAGEVLGRGQVWRVGRVSSREAREQAREQAGRTELCELVCELVGGL